MKNTSNTCIGINCVLAIVFTVVCIIVFVLTHRRNDAANTTHPWCYNDWSCNAPKIEAELQIFNSTHPKVCGSSACTAGEPYNVYKMVNTENSINGKQNCQDPINDGDAVVVNLVTGCQCMNTSVNPNLACTVNDLEKNVAGCEQETCGRFNKNCGAFVVNVPIDYQKYYGDDITPSDWICPGTSGSSPLPDGSITYTLCNYICPGAESNNEIDSDFFMNAFVYRYKKSTN